MAKLFVFGIGGTGSRVIKALTMLLASGVKMENTETVVPIIIDPDSANGDLTRTVEILRQYKEIYEKGNSDKSSFFGTKISSLDEVGDKAFASDNFKFEIDGVKDSLFKDYIGYNELDYANKAMVSLLFPKSNLEANMEVGFKGNPNIGSVVLNKFRDTNFFQKFAQSFGKNDRVFIISSIFGGTGAAGFPLILKNIRGAEDPVPNYGNLQKAKIGAITVLPYFSINKVDSNTEIESDTFISKTKAALSYYAMNVSGNQSVNALYYIGDEFTDNMVEGHDGASKQKNKAHFVELASALAIVDFMSLPDSDLVVDDGRALRPRYYEYGLNSEYGKKDKAIDIKFKDLGKTSHDIVAKPMTQYALFDLFYKSYFAEASKMAFALNGNNKLQPQSIDNRFSAALTAFNRYFEEWLTEMAGSTIAFKAFKLDLKKDDLLNLVNGSPEKTKFFGPNGHEFYVQSLNETDKKDGLDTLSDSNRKLLATFANATERVIKERISL